MPAVQTSEPTPAPKSDLVILIRDLILGSRVVAAAKNAGVALVHIRDPARLAVVAGRRLIVDLNQEGAIPAAGRWKSDVPDRFAIGFVSHVDADTARAAREAGIDKIMARSRFVELLPSLLSGERADNDPS
ncbi:hypothetical protein [Humisphaera borealis]|uniref:Uncharacterized protein n=1 Tax=Humisphaera borealis TaxID=2807512 RepID=A0A7M2WS64_9BACT|nr:hypothetical protein [Humisphaera borealis]QOV88348.1 hypothetical protein IPV69_19145 [Humisphaera borealis]